MSIDICYILSHGFAARMILHSDVIPEVRARGLSVAVILPGGDEPQMASLAARLDVEIRQAPPVRSRAVASLLRRSRPYFREDIAGNPALRAKHERGRAEHRLRRYVPDPGLLLNRALSRSPLVERLYSGAEQRLLSDPAAARMLAELSPRLLVSTYPVNHLEAVFLREAERAGIPTVGHLLSWDNVTTKGRFAVPPGHYVSWGPVMTAELHQYYAPPPGHVFECGVPHFDRHVSAPSREGLDRLLRGLELDPARPYLFFGMSSPYFAPHEIDVVEWLAGRLTAGAFGPDLQLVVRPHPQNVQGHMADQSWLPRLSALVGPRVAVDYPALERSALRYSMKEEDLPHLANLLAGCAVCLNSGSTLSIDAVIHDKPVILTSFDADRDIPWSRSARRVLEYPHLAKLVAFGGVRTVASLADLEQVLHGYLRDPSLDADGRARTRAEECGPCDGGASRRVAEALHTIRTGARTAEQARRAAS